MKCPKCGDECKKGIVIVKDAGSLTQSLTMINWYPEENNGKIRKKDAVSLRLKAEGYYCEECMKVYSAFDEK